MKKNWKYKTPLQELAELTSSQKVELLKVLFSKPKIKAEKVIVYR